MSSKRRAGLQDSAAESLCCCEYVNMLGDKSHLLAVCCDCEALDETFDRLFKCQRVPESTIDRLLNTIADRCCRLPTCFGRGAVQLRPDVVTPIVVVPACLLLATLHPVVTALVFCFMPLFIVVFHTLWRRRDSHRRSKFFYCWGVSSVISSYLVFQFFVVAFREVLLWEILTVFSLMMIMFYFLYLTKQDPDQLVVKHKFRPTHKRTPSNPPVNDSPALYEQLATRDKDLVGEGLPADLPDRSGYCQICESYIGVRDHHCVWIDSCVGGSNHRVFYLTILTFLLTGVYSVHLTLTTICTPRMYLDWFLLPNDCRWLYHDFLTAICFVTAIYCTIATLLMSVGCLFQTILISQNVTSHELARARRQGKTACFFFVRDNPYNKGFLKNWVEFWFLPSRSYTAETTV